MNIVRNFLILIVAIPMFFLWFVHKVDAAGPKVSELASGNLKGNKHNLSAIARQFGTTSYVANINTYKATNDPTNNPRGQQICIFCHTPHSANVAEQAPLWNRAFSSQTFQRYSSAKLHIRNLEVAEYAQPNGSSKLCLSCHDGVSRLGAVYNGAEIEMVNVNPVIQGLASFNASTNKMLKGHHPVSFVYLTGFTYSATPQSGKLITGLPASFRFLPQSSAHKVKLFDTKRNGNGWMQCTTCHNPHQNQSDETVCYDAVGVPVTCDVYTRKVAPFWAYHGSNTSASQDTRSVCKVCHAFQNFIPPWPYPNP